MKSGATESSFHYLAQHYQFPDDVDVQRTTQEIIQSNKKYKVIWAHDNCDQYGHKDLPQHIDKINLIVCVSNWEKEQYIKFNRAPEHLLTVIPNGVDNMFRPSNKPKSKTCIFFSAPHKGVAPLVPIWKEVIKKHPDAKLKVFSSMSLYGDVQPGEGENETITGLNGFEPSPFVPVYKELKELEGVEYSPCIDREDLLSHVQDAAFYIHPNVWEETFCVSLAEAMSCGCFPITSDIGALRETSQGLGKYVIMSGNNTPRGWEPDDTFINKFTQEVITALDYFDRDRSNYEEATKTISEFAIQNYNWERIAGIWKETISSLTHHRSIMESNKSNLELVKATEAINEESDYMMKVYGECTRWQESENELAQGRSNFQIEKFIVLDNFTVPSAFKAALINRRSVAEGLLSSIIELKKRVREFEFRWEGKDKSKPIWWKTREGGEELVWYDIDEFQLNAALRGADGGFRDSIQQLEFFDKLIERLVELNDGKLISKKQFEEDQPLYWERRFANQAFDDLVGAKSGISPGNIRSMRRGTAPTVLTDDVNRIKGDYGSIADALGPNVERFLGNLQQKVSEGINEVTEFGASLKAAEERQALAGTQEVNADAPKSLFNHESVSDK